MFVEALSLLLSIVATPIPVKIAIPAKQSIYPEAIRNTIDLLAPH